MSSSPEPAANSEPQDHLPPEVDASALRKYFTLTDADLVQVEQCRGSVNRLGFAVQLCALRWRGHFLPDARDLPRAVLEMLAPQLGVLAMPIPEYPQNEKTRWEHMERIRQHLGFIKCEEAHRQQLFTHLQSQAVTMPRPATLQVEACRWLVEQRIVRPGRTTLREIVGAAKESALQQVYGQLNGALSISQQKRLDDLLLPVPTESPAESAGRSRAEQFKLLARRESPAAFAALAARLADVQSVGLATFPVLQQIHPATRAVLASWGYRYNVWSLRRFKSPKRYSILLAFLQAALAETLDAIVEMQDKLITKVHNNARERREEMLRSMERARTRAVVVLEDLGALVIDETRPRRGTARANLRSLVGCGHCNRHR